MTPRRRERPRGKLPPLARLPATPEPAANETLASYVGRVAQANGLPFPRRLIARLTGIQEGVYRLNIDLERLASAVGRDPEHLEIFREDLTLGQGGRIRFGLPSRGIARGLRDAGLCPLCVAETGYVTRNFDLACVLVCPDHGCRVVAACPSCGQGLALDRPAIDTCICGSSLTGEDAVSFECRADELAISEVLSFSFLRDKDFGFAAASGYPTKILRELPFLCLHEFLLQLYRLAVVGSGPIRTVDAERFVPAVHRLLSNWPHAFVDHVRALTAEPLRRSALNLIFRGQPSLVDIRRVKPAQTEGWWRPLIDALHLGLSTGRPFYLGPHRLLLFDDRPWPWVSRWRAAEKVGITLRQLKFAAEVGEVEVTSGGEHGLAVTSASIDNRPIRELISRIRIEDATEELGFPPKLLKQLIASNSLGLSIPYSGYGITAAAASRIYDAFLSCAEGQPAREDPPPPGVPVMSVANLLGSIGYDRPFKVDLVRKLLAGEITAWRRRSSFTQLELVCGPEIVLNRSARRYGAGSGPDIDFTTAGQHFQCSVPAVRELANEGFLERGAAKGRFETIKLSSLHKHSARYASLGEIQMLCGLPAVTVMKRMSRIEASPSTIRCRHSGARFYARDELGSVSCLAVELLA